MILAAQHVAMALAIVEKMAGAMAAKIVKAPQLALAILDHEDAPAGDFGRNVIAGIGQRRQRPDELPLAGEDVLPLALEDIGPVIPIGGQRQYRFRFQGDVHGWNSGATAV